MKFISTEFKPVSYFNYDLIVHKDARFLAADNDGRVFAFSDKPALNKECGSWWPADSHNPNFIAEHVATYDLASCLPAHSLVEIK